MGKATRSKTVKPVVPSHVCGKKERGYEWPCPVCFPHYYRQNSGISWYVLVIVSGVAIEQRGPIPTEYDADRYARNRFKRLDQDTDSIFWLKIKNGVAYTGSYPGDFFEKA